MSYDTETFVFTNNAGLEKMLTNLGFYIFVDTLKGEGEIRLFKEKQGII